MNFDHFYIGKIGQACMKINEIAKILIENLQIIIT